METRTKIMLAVAAMVAVGSWQGVAPLPNPIPTPKPDGPDLVAVFANAPQGHGATDAGKFGAMCRAIESRLTRERTSAEDKRRLTTGIKIDDFRLQVRVDYMESQSFNAKYPGLKPVLVEWFDVQVGKTAGKVDDAQLDKWIGAFRKLGENAEYASKQL